MEKNRKKKIQEIKEKIDNIYLETLSDKIKVIKNCELQNTRENDTIINSFVIVGLLACLNSLYEKYMRQILEEYLNLWKLSKKNTKKEFKLILALKYKKNKQLQNLNFKEINNLNISLKNGNILDEIDPKLFKKAYKSFENTENIYEMLIKEFHKEPSDEEIEKLKEKTEEIKKYILEIDSEILNKVEQIKFQLKSFYENNRTQIIHGEYKNFEDISITNPLNTKMFATYSIIWIIIIKNSMKKLADHLL